MRKVTTFDELAAWLGDLGLGVPTDEGQLVALLERLRGEDVDNPKHLAMTLKVAVLDLCRAAQGKNTPESLWYQRERRLTVSDLPEASVDLLSEYIVAVAHRVATAPQTAPSERELALYNALKDSPPFSPAR